MKTKPFILILGGSLLLLCFIPAVNSNYHRRSEATKAMQALAKLPASRMLEALDCYRRKQSAKAAIIPEKVSLDTLLVAGCIQTKEVSFLAGMPVMFSTAEYIGPAEELVRIFLATGDVVVMLGDGSVSTRR